jgi:hypothetical protein
LAPDSNDQGRNLQNGRDNSSRSRFGRGLLRALEPSRALTKAPLSLSGRVLTDLFRDGRAPTIRNPFLLLARSWVGYADQMKQLLCLVTSVTLFALPAFAQEAASTNAITAFEAGNHIGEKVAVVGKVAEIHKTEKVIHINFETKYPSTPFNAVIFAPNFYQFTNVVDQLEGARIEVTGRIEDFKGKPQVILNKPFQLRVIEPAKQRMGPAKTDAHGLLTGKPRNKGS